MEFLQRVERLVRQDFLGRPLAEKIRFVRTAAGYVLRRARQRFARPAPRTPAGAGPFPNFAAIEGLARFDHQIEALFRNGLNRLPHLTAGESRQKEVARIFGSLDPLFEHRYRFLVCIPYLKIGGAERVAANLVKALHRVCGANSVAVVVVDHAADHVRAMFPNDKPISSWFPQEVPVVDATRIQTLDAQTRIEAFAKLLLAVDPEFVVVVNSKTAWECLLRYGEQLRRHMRLAACLFCTDRNAWGAPVGHATDYFRETIRHLNFVISDHRQFLEELTARYGLIPSEQGKLRHLYQSVSLPAMACETTRYERLRRPLSYRRQLLWAGRVTRQKNPELLIEIARRAPHYDIHVFGPCEKGYRLPKLPNLIHHGAFVRFEDIPTSVFDAFLYTSLWDGLPNILLEAAAHRLPVVAPLVGGIGELVDETTGWPVSRADDLDEYVVRLREVCFEFDERRGEDRVQAMTRRLQERHSFDAFSDAVASLIQVPEGDPTTCPSRALSMPTQKVHWFAQPSKARLPQPTSPDEETAASGR